MYAARTLALVAACVTPLLAQPSLVSGQDAPAAEGAARKPVSTPPEIKEFVEAPYPPEAYKQGLSATVELEITIGVDGKVKNARVVTPAGNGFDEAALAAVQQFVFTPATREGKPIAARVRYPYVFEFKQPEPTPEAAPEAPKAPEPGRMEGQLLAIENDKPIVGAEVLVTPDGTEATQRVVTDEQGRFVLADLLPGAYHVQVSAVGREPKAQFEDVRSSETTRVRYRLTEPPDPEAFIATARIPPPPREVTRRTISKEQLTRIPGTRGDALRAVELMPGVARPPLGTGALIVRGSAPSDTLALFEGLPVALLYHFGGLTSFVNSRFIEDIDFYPGNFSVRYGRRRGGIIEVTAADIPKDGFHGVIDANLIDTSVMATTPLSEDAELALAVRRSYFDVLFGAALSSADISTVAAPVYYDYQAEAVYRPTQRDKLRLMVYGSRDEFALLFEQPSDADVSVSGDFDFSTEFHRAHGSWRRKVSDRVDQDVDIAANYLNVDFGIGDAFDFNLHGTEIYGRSEWRARVTDDVRLISGVDLFFLPGRFTYSGPPPEATEGNPSGTANGATFANRDQITAVDEFFIVQPAIYLEAGLTLSPWSVQLGSRVDYYEEVDDFSYDPRASAQFALTESTKLKGGIGMFSQPPQFQESSPELGNPNLDPTHTLHLGAGVEQEIDKGFSIALDGFYKHLYDNIVGTELGQAPFFTNDGQGRIFGAELLVRMTKGRFFAYLSYTLSRSERNDRESGWRLFDFDQPHILTAAAVYRLGRGWEVGGTFRLVSGNPDTQVEGSTLNVIAAQYSPVFGRTNAIRSPTFSRLDLRVEKQWTFTAWKLALYLDVQNATNATNGEGFAYDYEYRENQEIIGLPIIPILGLRGEM